MQLSQEVEALELASVPLAVVESWHEALRQFSTILDELDALFLTALSNDPDANAGTKASAILPELRMTSEIVIRGIISLLSSQKLTLRALSKVRRFDADTV